MTKARAINLALIALFALSFAYCQFAPAAEPEPAKKPPMFSVGVFACGKPVVLWVSVDQGGGVGSVHRFDKEHPIPDEQMDAFLAWLTTGPSDYVTFPCLKKGTSL